MPLKFFIGLIAIILLYLFVIYTLTYGEEIKKSPMFSMKLKLFHLIMIWIIPFLWIVLLKILTKPAPGSYEIDNKQDNEPFSDAYRNPE